MSHLLEQYGSMASFASLRENAWHGLGEVFNEEVSTDEMLRLAHMNDWNIRLEPIVLPAPSHKDFFAVVRDNPYEPWKQDTLGIVGKRYNPFQNEQLFEFGSSILGDGARWETAGSIKNGTVVFASLALERETVLDPTGVADVVKSYLLAHSSHDGTLAIRASITPVRVVCHNTLTMAVGRRGNAAKQSFAIRHTDRSQDKIKQAREALGLADKYLDAFEVEAKALYEQAVTNDQFAKMIAVAYPSPKTVAKGNDKKYQTKVDELWSIFNGPTNVGIDGTAWAAYNTFVERLDWFKSPRGGNAANVLAAASGFDDVTTAEKNRLLKVVKQVAFA